MCERPGQASVSATVGTTRTAYVVDQPKRFGTTFERRKPGVMNAVVLSGTSVIAIMLADCASQGYLAASIDAHRRASQFTGSMIVGSVLCGLPLEALKLTYAKFIHLHN